MSHKTHVYPSSFSLKEIVRMWFR
uniref:Uncharacterized protein n=1 Tax=Arundo donax TaxID=35708 RepID=A0A0A9BZK4_ARUDO